MTEDYQSVYMNSSFILTVFILTRIHCIMCILYTPTMNRYSIMLDCWEAEATDRPSFSYLVRHITSHLEKMAGEYLEIVA